MPEPETKPRRRFQLHLSTCILVMIVAGVLLGLNLQRNPHWGRNESGIRILDTYDMGWPFYFYGNYYLGEELLNAFRYKQPKPSGWEKFRKDIERREIPFDLHSQSYDPGIRWREFAANLVLWLMMLGLPAYLSEVWIRRRKREREGAQSRI